MNINDCKRIYWACNPNMLFSSKKDNSKRYRVVEWGRYGIYVREVVKDKELSNKAYKWPVDDLVPVLKRFSSLTAEDGLEVAKFIDSKFLNASKTLTINLSYSDFKFITVKVERYVLNGIPDHLLINFYCNGAVDVTDLKGKSRRILDYRFQDLLRSKGYNLDFRDEDYINC